jgi:C-terminal processing protease CtpA/Prc
MRDQAAYIRMPTWALYNSKWDWKRFLDRGFDDLIDRKVPTLIIDLRGNEGGLDVGHEILARLAPKPVRIGSFQRFTRYQKLPAKFEPYLSTWDPSFKNWGDAAKPAGDGYFRMTKFDDSADGDILAPRGRRYEGRVVVLTDASNSSATFQFAKTIKETKLATLVGQTTGGSQRGINGGAFFFMTLPQCKIEIDLPLVAIFPQGSDRPPGVRIPFGEIPSSGIEPDIVVAPSVDDITNDSDTVLQAALKLK